MSDITSHVMCDIMSHHVICHVCHHVTSCHFDIMSLQVICPLKLQITHFEQPVEEKNYTGYNCTKTKDKKKGWGKIQLLLSEGNLKEVWSARKHDIFTKPRKSFNIKGRKKGSHSTKSSYFLVSFEWKETMVQYIDGCLPKSRSDFLAEVFICVK